MLQVIIYLNTFLFFFLNFLIDLDHEHVFELQCDEKNYVLAARSEQEKSQWLCLLMYIRNKR